MKLYRYHIIDTTFCHKNIFAPVSSSERNTILGTKLLISLARFTVVRVYWLRKWIHSFAKSVYPDDSGEVVLKCSLFLHHNKYIQSGKLYFLAINSYPIVYEMVTHPGIDRVQSCITSHECQVCLPLHHITLLVVCAEN